MQSLKEHVTQLTTTTKDNIEYLNADEDLKYNMITLST